MIRLRLRFRKREQRRYPDAALEIHAATCTSPGWCNYGQPVPPEIRPGDSLPWPQQRERAGKRLAWYRHCQAAVDAENHAARAAR